MLQPASFLSLQQLYSFPPVFMTTGECGFSVHTWIRALKFFRKICCFLATKYFSGQLIQVEAVYTCFFRVFCLLGMKMIHLNKIRNATHSLSAVLFMSACYSGFLQYPPPPQMHKVRLTTDSTLVVDMSQRMTLCVDAATDWHPTSCPLDSWNRLDM